ncbi:MAG: hypothetical protein ABIA63_06045 [bacterium]
MNVGKKNYTVKELAFIVNKTTRTLYNHYLSRKGLNAFRITGYHREGYGPPLFWKRAVDTAILNEEPIIKPRSFDKL